MKLAEVGQTESLLGATLRDHPKTWIKVEKQAEVPSSERAAGVTAINDYRARLPG